MGLKSSSGPDGATDLGAALAPSSSLERLRLVVLFFPPSWSIAAEQELSRSAQSSS